MPILKAKQIAKRLLPPIILNRVRAFQLKEKRFTRWRDYVVVTRGKIGLEIGGPSRVFSYIMPVYPVASQVDGVNFSTDTIWEGKILTGLTYKYYAKKRGRQFISEAAELRLIEDDKYDFLLSSNCLEHVANPLQAVFEWRRVLKSNGALILLLPYKDGNFDHRRPFTSFQHILQDYEQKIGEDDLTHLDEILELHDLSMDAPAGTSEQFRQRSLQNASSRTLHHHVFDLGLGRKMLQYAGFDVRDATQEEGDLYFLALKKADISSGRPEPFCSAVATLDPASGPKPVAPANANALGTRRAGPTTHRLT